VGGHTVLQVPVAQLEPFVRARAEHYDRDWVSADPAFTHAHVTALGPFVDADRLTGDVLAVVAGIARATSPFDFTLRTVSTFPNGIIHLVPEPEKPFRALTDRLGAAFPDHPPYAGQFPDVRPHLTLDARSAEVGEASTRALLGDLVPARCRADRLDLAWYEAGSCRVLHTWRLGAATGVEVS
jgi:2'-5' RNA ligase